MPAFWTLPKRTTLNSDAVFNSSGTVKVKNNALLQIDDAKVFGGTVTDNGTVEISGSARSPMFT